MPSVTSQVVSAIFALSETFLVRGHCKTYKTFLAHFVYKIKNILIYLYLIREENPNSHSYDVENCIKMDKAKIFVAHLATSCGAPFENHCTKCMK
jgi:hypothetical protein